MGGLGFLVDCMCEIVYNSNSHMVDGIRMQMEVQRRLTEQLEVSNFQITQLINFSLSLHKICISLPWACIYTKKKHELSAVFKSQAIG